MPAALEMPLQAQHTKSRTTEVTEFAAAASCPRCPMNAVYDVKPTPQNRHAPKRGRLHFTKSRVSGLFFLKKFDNFGEMKSFLSDIATTQRHSMILEMSVAMAAPWTPIGMKPNRPKIKTAFNAMFITTVTELMQALCLAWSLIFMTVR